MITPATQLQWDEVPLAHTSRSVFLHEFGDTATGRSTFALTAPGPIAYFRTLENTERALPTANMRHVELYDTPILSINIGASLVGTSQQIKDESRRLLDKLWLHWRDACDNWARTVILDIHNDLWKYCQTEFFGSDSMRLPENQRRAAWGDINVRWDSFINHALVSMDRRPLNVIMIGKVTDEYKGQKKTGRLVRKDTKELTRQSNVTIRTYRNSAYNPATRTQDYNFSSRILKPWDNWNVASDEFEMTPPWELRNELSTFPNMMSLITGVSPLEWGWSQVGSYEELVERIVMSRTT